MCLLTLFDGREIGGFSSHHPQGSSIGVAQEKARANAVRNLARILCVEADRTAQRAEQQPAYVKN